MAKKVVGQIYHVLNRGVDKRDIFLDDEDRFRFVHDLFEFNDVAPINNVKYYFNQTSKAIARPYINVERRPRKLLVEILAFCMMTNHYHLLLRPLSDNGITHFMKRLNMGYAHYFNLKYQRSGALFQGRYKSVHVVNDAHFIHLPYYIHLNPLDLYMPRWREREISNYQQALKFLKKYRWSSHLDYMGIKNLPSVTQRGFLLKFWDNSQYENGLIEWLKSIELQDMNPMLLE
ncbi:MAG: transposase [bacterium]|nr:transposase [bacterium]